MKRVWFRRRRYGWGWYPAIWQGWLATLFFAAVFAARLFLVRPAHRPDNEVLLTIILPAVIWVLIFITVAWRTGEEPHWQWGKRKVFLEDVLRGGGTAVVATDTTYGIVGSAWSEKAVNEIYRLRKRDLNKPFIVLIEKKSDLKKFGVHLSPAQTAVLNKVWPGAVSVIVPCPSDKFSYLHRGGKTLAFRLPQKESLDRLIHRVGPLVAPSANPQGHPVARTIAEAKAYFGNHIGFYEDSGEVANQPSKIIDITDGTEKVLRA